MNYSVILKPKTYNPRRNLPAHVAGKRAEANFTGAFQRHFVAETGAQGLGAPQFAISGYGIADFVWLTNPTLDTTLPLSKEGVHRQLLGTELIAFEMKLTDWKKAIQQAYRYSYFAETSVVVLPALKKTALLSKLDLFKQLEIGLWFFDPNTPFIDKVFTPARTSPRNLSAKAKAVSLFSRQFYLRALRKR